MGERAGGINAPGRDEMSSSFEAGFASHLRMRRPGEGSSPLGMGAEIFSSPCGGREAALEG
jgi:hypothetical protein